jgi:adenosine deaminase CECR1
MGSSCSVDKEPCGHNVEKDAADIISHATKPVKKIRPRHAARKSTDRLRSYTSINSDQYHLVAPLDNAIKVRSRKRSPRPETVLERGDRPPTFSDTDDYERQRQEIANRESILAFDHACLVKASPLEVRANRVLQALRDLDVREIYDKAPQRKGYAGQRHRRFMGDHFLGNVELIEQTKVYDVARRMPKGAHLHIHFNANLLPDVLINIAKPMERMFISSDIPLIPQGHDKMSHEYYHKFNRCKIQFSILPPGGENDNPGNLFDPDYPARGTMRFRDFLDEFGRHYSKCTVDEWLKDKIVFHEKEAHDYLQTTHGSVSCHLDHSTSP